MNAIASNVVEHPPIFTRNRMRNAVVRWLSREGCSHALTLNLNRAVTIPKLSTMFGNFCLEMDRACLGKKNVSKVASADRLFAFACVEHPTSNIHLHVALRLDGWWKSRSPMCVDDRIWCIWGSITRGAGSTWLRSIEDDGWGRYITKVASARDGEYFLSGDYHPRH